MGHQMVVLENKLYIIGGNIYENSQKECFKLDDLTKECVRIADLK